MPGTTRLRRGGQEVGTCTFKGVDGRSGVYRRTGAGCARIALTCPFPCQPQARSGAEGESAQALEGEFQVPLWGPRKSVQLTCTPKTDPPL